MIPILQHAINLLTIPLWIVAITMLTLAIRACWFTFRQ